MTARMARGLSPLLLLTLTATGCGQTGGEAPEVVRSAVFGSPSVGACQPSHLTLHGFQPMRGPTAGAPVQIVPVLWGANTTFGFTTAQVDSFIANAFASPWWSWIRREYHLSNVAEAAWRTLDLTKTVMTTGNDGKAEILDTDIQSEIRAQLANGTLPQNTGGTVAGMLYVIHLPSTVAYAATNDKTMELCGGADGSRTSGGLACGYNSSSQGFVWTDGTAISYAVVPDITTGTCKAKCPRGGTAAWDTMTSSESHELVEAMTDPSGFEPGVGTTHGWYATTAGCQQIADMCETFNVTTTGPTGSVVVQKMWSNAGNVCGGNNPGARGDLDSQGTTAIVLSGDTNPGVETQVHTAQAPIPASPAATTLAPIDFNLQLTGSDAWILAEKTGQPLVGDFTGDGVSDLALTGSAFADQPGALPVMRSTGSGALTRETGGMSTDNVPPELAGKVGADFPTLATQTPLPPVVGDFNGDGFADVALVGGANWTTIPVAFSTHEGLGKFWGVAEFDSGLNSYVSANTNGRTQIVSADFNGDGLDDLALVGLMDTPSVGRDFIAIALAHPDPNNNYRGDGTFIVRSWPMTAPAGGAATDFNTWANTPGVQAVAGDFDGDGFGDIALAGGSGWTTIPVAFSRGAVDGPTQFQVVNASGGGNASFASLAAIAGSQLLGGDFDGNGTWDLAVAGAPSLRTVALALMPEAPTSLGVATYAASGSNLTTFTQTAGRVNVFATAPSRGGTFNLVIPPTPAGLSASPVASRQMNVSWTASGGALTYTLFRAATSGGESPIASGLTTTSYVDTAVSPATKYFYKVGAVNLIGTSALSGEVSATTPAAGMTQLDCGGPATGSWIADTTTTGATKTWTNAVNTSLLTGTIPPQAVLQSGRVGNLTYNFTGLVANSSHTVTLYFVENYWSSSGSRLFTVKANGTAKLTNLDVYAAAGAKFKAILRTFTATADASGKLALTFVPSKDNATVEGIVVQ